ncbi:FAD-dependent oxidoreductase [uncultured Cetobacterium sp.]|uniref:NAD(P)/FAD-dependent oxidoreductase n=1 Tax=uncultured Cetobacterium sp. TaxID=527638 RepID=UPI002639FFBC|nr:FAD-dependent oxidoreductase [uncultured Cetobacterium sp.]
MKYDVVVIGGGPAGLAAAKSAYENGAQKVLILERDKELGGILQQCIHNGFGLHKFKEELTGPEYAQRYIEMVKESPIEIKLDTMVLNISKDRVISMINPIDGYQEIEAASVILAMGCRERTRGAIAIPGERPSGIFTAGAAQRYINMEGYMVGKKAVILGSGDIGLIMARRLTLEGAQVEAVIELMPFSGGLNRNIVQCLDDFGIPLLLSHTVVDIKGRDRLKKVIVAQVDENRKPIPGTEIEYDCDTLLLSVGLIPENDLSKEAGVTLDTRTNGPIVTDSMETSIPGVFACGNVVHVHDLVDFVSEEGERAGKFAACYIAAENCKLENVSNIKTGDGIVYTVPQMINLDNIKNKLEIFMRVNNVYKNKKIVVREGENIIASFKRVHLAPGEMEKILLPEVLLKRISKDITIELQEVI